LPRRVGAGDRRSRLEVMRFLTCFLSLFQGMFIRPALGSVLRRTPRRPLAFRLGHSTAVAGRRSAWETSEHGPSKGPGLTITFRLSKKRLCTPQPATARPSAHNRGIEFYCGVLGLTHKRQLSPRWVELAGANLPIFILADRQTMAELGTTRCHAISDGIGHPYTSILSCPIW
jgi:hypothetical protein